MGVYQLASDGNKNKVNKGYGYDTSAKNGFNAAVDGFIYSTASIDGYSVEAAMPNGTGGAAFRSDMMMCPMGWFCPGDGGGSPCPPGTYGNKVQYGTDRNSHPFREGLSNFNRLVVRL